MARNEVEVFFGRTQERHTAEAYRLSIIGAEALRRGDLEESDRIDQLVGIEKGRIRFLQGFVIEVLTRLKSEGINIPEVEPEESAPLPVETPPSPVTPVPQTFKAPDGYEIPGHTGKLLAFLAWDEENWIPKRTDVTAKHMYGASGGESENRLSALINRAKRSNSTPSKHGVIIDSHLPSMDSRTRGVKGFDWVSFVPQEAPVLAEEEIPETFTAPDGTELGGYIGKLLAFLAHQGTPKTRAESARHVYGKDDQLSVNKVTGLISYVESSDSAAFQHGVRIQTEKQAGVKVKDRVEVATIEQTQVAEVPLSLQAATLSKMLLEKREKLHVLGVELGPGDIRELEKSRQKIAGLDPEVRSRALEASKQLVVRFLADPEVVYDELAQDPEGGEDCQLALAPFTPLSELGEEVVDQLFEK